MATQTRVSYASMMSFSEKLARFSWGLFVGYAPTDNPRYAVCVVTEHAGGSGPAARTVAAVMKELLKGLK